MHIPDGSLLGLALIKIHKNKIKTENLGRILSCSHCLIDKIKSISTPSLLNLPFRQSFSSWHTAMEKRSIKIVPKEEEEHGEKLKEKEWLGFMKP